MAYLIDERVIFTEESDSLCASFGSAVTQNPDDALRYE
jgi:hypothetical protein